MYYRDYKPICADNSEQANGSTKPVLVFLHGWPYSSLAWETLTVQLCENHGFRCIAADRRGFGKSDWDGHQNDANITYETFAQDTVHLLERFLDVGPFVFITSSMGAGESVLALEASDYLRKNGKVRRPLRLVLVLSSI
jgi:pimeloyl-ACP methyl ester carboxylesterase